MKSDPLYTGIAQNDQGIHHDRSEAEHRYEFGVELGRSTDLHYYLRFT